MGNPETHASMDTRHRMKTNKTKQKHRKLKDEKHWTHKKRWWTWVLAKDWQFLFLIIH